MKNLKKLKREDLKKVKGGEGSCRPEMVCEFVSDIDGISIVSPEGEHGMIMCFPTGKTIC